MFDQIDTALYHPIRQAAYFFRGSEYMKFVPGAGVQSLRGSKIRRIGVDGWRTLPAEFHSDIDAAFCYSNGHIYFFKGNRYVKYKPGDGVVPTAAGDRIRTIGVTGWTSFPDDFRSDLDAAIYYPEREHAYFFKNNTYIKFKPGVGVINSGSQAIRRLGITGWQDLPEAFRQGVNAALYYPSNGRVYFFKGRDYVRWKPGHGVEANYPRRLGLRHRNGGGWPGLSTLLGGPFIGNVTSNSATVWMWLTGGKTTADLIVKLDGNTLINTEYRDPEVGTAATDVLEGVDGIDVGSMVKLLRISDLTSNSTHRVELCRADDRSVIESVVFKTAPRRDKPVRVRIGLGSCANTTENIRVPTFTAIAREKLDLLILCGDNCYYYSNDLLSTSRSAPGGPHDWSSVTRMLSRQLDTRNHPQFVPISQTVPVFSTWDDHDFSYNNCDGEGDAEDTRWVRRDSAAAVYRLMWNHPYRSDGNHINYDFNWGPLHFFMTDGRFHSKRDEWILGSDQCTWLLDGLRTSNAPIKIIVLGSQMIHGTSGETYPVASPAERELILNTIRSDAVQGRVLIFSGDVHFSECQREPEGSNTPKIVEVTSSPLRIDSLISPRPQDANRLWHTLHESFAVIDIDFRGVEKTASIGSVTIEAHDRDGRVLESDGPAGVCRTVWDLHTGELR